VIGVGLTLQPEDAYLDLLAGVIREEPDYYEVAPETLWRAPDPETGGELRPNGFHARFAALRARTQRPFVAHGVGFSVGSVAPERARRARWLARIEDDARVFGFEWYTDHLGATVLDGRELLLPLPLAMTAAMAGVVRASLVELQTVVPLAGVENSVFYFHLGDPLDEPAFLGRILDGPGLVLLLDLHNVHTSAVNAGFEAWEYVRRLPLEKVIEIHLAGGTQSDPAWLHSGKVLRLDSHDHAVPQEVWGLFERVLPLCPGLRGVTLERMEGTVGEADVEPIRAELRRARRILELARAR